MDDQSSRKQGELYVYALLFILTAITTVGYGNHSYGTRKEYLFVIVLEGGSILITALVVILVATSFDIKQMKFQSLIDKHMEDL